MAFNIVALWKKLPRGARAAIFVVALTIALAIAPELVPLLDVGGIELVLLVIVSYLKPTLRFVSRQIDAARNLIVCWHVALMRSSLAHPKVFFACATSAVALLVLTGSLMPFYAFWLPALMPYGPNC